jgi:anaerobic selenocysteine-containing dehydrogenase
MVAIDPYVNETTRHADVILPPCDNFSETHVHAFFSNFAARNTIRWSDPVVARKPDERLDWEILLELGERLGGGPSGVRALDGLYRIARKLGYRFTPDAILGTAMRLGPHGDRFLPGRGLNPRKVREAVHGLDLGPLEPGIARRIAHKHKRVDLAPQPMLDALAALERDVEREPRSEELMLIGRRDLRSNNSWMHNLPKLVSGRERCVLFVHPADAARCGVVDGGRALLSSRVHLGEVRVHVTDEIREGVVSLPHGWGHAGIAQFQRVAGATAGVSANDWTDDQAVEAIVGQSILNGVPVRLRSPDVAQAEAIG